MENTKILNNPSNIIDQKFDKFSDSLKESFNELKNIDYSIKENDKISVYLNNLLNKFADNFSIFKKFLANITEDDIDIIKDTLLNFLYLVDPKNIIQFIPDDMKAKIAENVELNTKSLYNNLDCKLSLFPDELKNNVKDLLLEIKGKNVVDVLENNLGDLNNISDSAKKAIPYLDKLVNGNSIRLYLINEIKNFNYEEFKKFILDFLRKLLLDDNLKNLQNEINIIFGDTFYKDIRSIDDILLFFLKYLQIGKHNILTNFDIKVLICIFAVPLLLFLINIPKSKQIDKYLINTIKPSFMIYNVNWYTCLIIFLQYFNILLIFLRVTFNDEIYKIIKLYYKDLNELTLSDEVTYQIIKIVYMYNIKYIIGILYILGITLSLINFKNEESHNISISRAFLTIFFIILIPELYFEKTLNTFKSNNYSLNIIIKIVTTIIVIYILDKSIMIITDFLKLYTNLGEKDKDVCSAGSAKNANYADTAKYATYADTAKYAKYAENADNIVDNMQNSKIRKNDKNIFNKKSDTLLMIRFISIIIFAFILQHFNLNQHIQFNDNENINGFIQIIASIFAIVIFDYIFQNTVNHLQIHEKSNYKININYKLIIAFILFLSILLIANQKSNKIKIMKVNNKNICIL